MYISSCTCTEFLDIIVRQSTAERITFEISCLSVLRNITVVHKKKTVH